MGIGFQPEVLGGSGKGYSRTSVNTTIFRKQPVVTHGDEQYIDIAMHGRLSTLGKRMAGSEQWTLHRTQYKGNVEDAHNAVSIMLRRRLSPCGFRPSRAHPLNYCRSLPLFAGTGREKADDGHRRAQRDLS